MNDLFGNAAFPNVEPNGGITPDDSPANDERLQAELNLVDVKPQELAVTPQNNTGGGNTLRQIELFLSSRYLFRYNLVSHKVEFCKNNVNSIRFQDMTDYDYNSLLRDIKHADLPCSKDALRTLLASHFTPSFDPYREYVERLPEWDGRTDYIRQLADTVQTDNPEYWLQWFQKWLVAMAISWIEPDVVNHTALILSGKQGIGKTRWLSRLIPEPLRRYIYAGTINVRDKDSLVKLSECPIVIMDELENAGGRNVDALKELITKSDIYVRRAYGYTHENYIRRASFAGSINSKDFLHDITGNRRFLCFDTLSIDYQHKVDLEQVYAQAIWLARNRFQYWFDAQEIAEVETHNEAYRAVCPEEEQLTTFFERCNRDDPDALFMKTTDIIRDLLRLSGLRSLSEQKLGRVLQKLNFERLKMDGRYKYALKLRQPQIEPN